MHYDVHMSAQESTVEQASAEQVRAVAILVTDLARRVELLAPSVVTDGWVLGPETIGVLRNMGQTLESIYVEQKAQREVLFEMYATFKQLEPTIAGARVLGKITNPFRKAAPHGTTHTSETGPDQG